jgi:iron complex transport system substrate-binding protein
LAAGPPASVLFYTLAPQKMIGWVRSPGSAQKVSLLEIVHDLPDYGRPIGRGNTANLENVLKFEPDQIDPSEQQVDALLKSAAASKRER